MSEADKSKLQDFSWVAFCNAGPGAEFPEEAMSEASHLERYAREIWNLHRDTRRTEFDLKTSGKSEEEVKLTSQDGVDRYRDIYSYISFKQGDQGGSDK